MNRKLTLLLGLVTSATLFPLHAMDIQEKKEISASNYAEYINVRQCIFKLTALALSDSESSDEEESTTSLQEEIGKTIISSLRLDTIPVELGTKKGQLKDFWNTHALVQLLGLMHSDYYDKQSENTFATYAQLLEKCLIWPSLLESLEPQNCLTISMIFQAASTTVLDASSYYVFLELVAKLCGTSLSSAFELDALEELLKDLVSRTSLTFEKIVPCLNLDLLVQNHPDQLTKEEIKKALSGLLQLLSDFSTNKQKAFEKLLRCFALFGKHSQKKSSTLQGIYHERI
ncbi:hypothetical protein H0X06_04065 [Candidatus Dependentiae bacterium]|nr:hypothetical protein [Candidatus Dependentiae bacterium]